MSVAKQSNVDAKWAVPIWSIGLWRWRGQHALLDRKVRICLPWQTARIAGVLGWGFRESGERAHEWAARAGVRAWRLEDGFLRSTALGVEGSRALSLVIDDLGIYYDASRPSRLEALVQQPAADTLDAERAMQAIVRHGLSKYNHAPDFTPPEGWRGNEVLVIDQTRGDVAVRLGGADELSFLSMLFAALDDNPDATVYVKTHPDVMCGKKQGYLTDAASRHPRVRLLPLDVSPVSLLKHVGRVYAVSSQMGFEALMCGKPVATFGLPWYACWGLTDDRHPDAARIAQRRGRTSLPQLFDAAYLRYGRYLHPDTGARGTIFDVIDHLARHRRHAARRDIELVCVGLSLWKSSVIGPFLRQGARAVRFVKDTQALRVLPPLASRQVVLWGAGQLDVEAVARELGLPVRRMEDGFVRSVGLGSNLVAPLSLVIDDLGIYFDPRTPSRLETILRDTVFDTHELAQARALRERLVASRIGKYNVGSGGIALPSPRPAKVILVPGQVEDDASIRTGAPWIATNLGLLAAVRERNPQAYIVFKPHPDVVSGNRRGAIAPEDAARLADSVAPEADVLACLDQVDEVHTMTSLTGFEALLRGKQVVCYGAPFYAGWGLTHDVFREASADAGHFAPYEAMWQRRSRALTLDELVAGALMHYPLYLHPRSRTPISAMTAVELLQKQRDASRGERLKRNRLLQQIGKLDMFIRSVSSRAARQG
jgi:capsular polysaccharide export protein